MKNIFFIVALLGMIACGANREVPSKVTKAFEKRFAKAEHLSWEVSENKLIAHFEEGDFAKTAYFSPNAKWLRTTTLLHLDELKPCIIDYIQEDYHGIEIINAELVENLSGKRYFITIQNIGDDIEDTVTSDLDPLYNELEDTQEMAHASFMLQLDPNYLDKDDDHFGAIKLIFDEACNFLGEQ